MSGFCCTGLRGGTPPKPIIIVGGGLLPGHRGLMPRWDIDVKFERSDSAGLRAPSGVVSMMSVSIAGGGGVGLGTEGAGLGGSAKRGSTSST